MTYCSFLNRLKKFQSAHYHMNTPSLSRNDKYHSLINDVQRHYWFIRYPYLDVKSVAWNNSTRFKISFSSFNERSFFSNFSDVILSINFSDNSLFLTDLKPLLNSNLDEVIQSDIAQNLKTAPMNVSTILNKFEKSEIIYRKTSTKDTRAKPIFLTNREKNYQISL